MLNERCRVFLDLAEILSDNAADAKMSYITWIIIILIVVSIIVTVTEVGLRFGIISKEKGKDRDSGNSGGPGNVIGGGGGEHVELRSVAELARAGNVSLEELRLWSAALSERERAAVCGSGYVGKTFAGV